MKGFELAPEGSGEPAESFMVGRDMTGDMGLIQVILRTE